MKVWKAGALASGLAVVAVCGGCQLSDPEGGLQLSRMIPKPGLGSPVPEQGEPDPDSLYGTETASESAAGDEP